MPDPPEAMRERFAQQLKVCHEKWIGDEYRAQRLPMVERDAFDAGFTEGWQAAHPSSEKIEEVARRIATEILRRHNGFGKPPDVDDIAAILREELGGKK